MYIHVCHINVIHICVSVHKHVFYVHANTSMKEQPKRQRNPSSIIRASCERDRDEGGEGRGGEGRGEHRTIVDSRNRELLREPYYDRPGFVVLLLLFSGEKSAGSRIGAASASERSGLAPFRLPAVRVYLWRHKYSSEAFIAEHRP